MKLLQGFYLKVGTQKLYCCIIWMYSSFACICILNKISSFELSSKIVDRLSKLAFYSIRLHEYLLVNSNNTMSKNEITGK